MAPPNYFFDGKFSHALFFGWQVVVGKKLMRSSWILKG